MAFERVTQRPKDVGWVRQARTAPLDPSAYLPSYAYLPTYLPTY